MAVNSRFEAFEPDLEDWDAYLARFEFHLPANKVDDEDQQKATLLSSYRHAFYKRSQAANETIAEYVSALRKAARPCTFSDLEEALLDRLVCGMKDKKLQQRLFAREALTYAVAYSEAVAAEAAEKATQEVRQNLTPIQQGASKSVHHESTSESEGEHDDVNHSRALRAKRTTVKATPRRNSCKPVPDTMTLCHGVGYSEMRLPNLLGHDTVREALQQSASWVPLLTKQCHRDTKKFLCSLFAPVCLSELEEPVFPCRSLCEDVREGCSPVMAAFGFPWPEMLNCSRFPRGNELCIPPAGSKDGLLPPKEDAVFPACLDKGHNEQEFLEIFCSQDFALKMSIRSVSAVEGDLKVVAESRGRTLYRKDGWSEEELKKPVLWLAGGEACACQELAGPGAVVLAMGRRGAGRLVISWVRKWRHGEKEMKKFSRAVRKLRC
ncbi:PREDICTED: secreted frizzled-related protein 2-like [Gekko japonicus]|uniref:Secreted frizzled-related protein 2-like n=1 Tax=Gekko japonicus TaxID=146911 RepID=A0ABM1JKJ8_GEKJA|nr:PREDICTED: secreted frizzled-related protein 2-like [Gekko japonicus]